MGKNKIPPVKIPSEREKSQSMPEKTLDHPWKVGKKWARQIVAATREKEKSLKTCFSGTFQFLWYKKLTDTSEYDLYQTRLWILNNTYSIKDIFFIIIYKMPPLKTSEYRFMVIYTAKASVKALSSRPIGSTWWSFHRICSWKIVKNNYFHFGCFLEVGIM